MTQQGVVGADAEQPSGKAPLAAQQAALVVKLGTPEPAGQ